jgi:hypothetical protein
MSTTLFPTTTSSPQLYFNNNQIGTVDLKKAEILVYYGDKGAIHYKTIGFPGVNTISDFKQPIVISPKDAKIIQAIVIDGISSNFYPISMTAWGKQYDDNKFRMVELNDNSTNRTEFEVQSNNTIKMTIETGAVLRLLNIGANATTATGKARLSTATNNNPILIGKYIILYDEQTGQSVIKSTVNKENYRESYRYIGIM